MTRSRVPYYPSEAEQIFYLRGFGAIATVPQVIYA